MQKHRMLLQFCISAEFQRQNSSEIARKCSILPVCVNYILHLTLKVKYQNSFTISQRTVNIPLYEVCENNVEYSTNKQ